MTDVIQMYHTVLIIHVWYMHNKALLLCIMYAFFDIFGLIFRL